MPMAGKRLPALLNAYSAGALRQMAEGRQLKLTATRKAAVVDALARDAGKQESVARMLGLLSTHQRALLDLLLLYPGEVAQRFISSAAVAAGLVARNTRDADYPYYYGYSRQESGNPAAADSTSLADLVAGLSYHVLALSSASTGSYMPALDLGLAGQLTVPAEIRPTLVNLTATEVPTLTEPPGPVSAADPRRVHRALFLLWSAVREKPVSLTQAGLVRKTDARRLGQALGVADKATEFDAEPDLPYLYFVRRMAGRLGLLAGLDGRLEPAARDRLRDFLAEPWPQRTLRMLQTWAGPDALQIARDTARASSDDGNATTPAEPRYLTEKTVVEGYRRLLGLLVQLPDAWIDLDAFVAWMRKRHFGWLALDDPDPFAVHDLGTQLYHLSYGFRSEVDPWAVYEGAAIREGLRAALHWLGVVDLAGDDGAPAFRLTAAGRGLLEAYLHPKHADEWLAPLAGTAGTGRVIVQPNFQILAVGDVPEDTLFALSEIADLVRAEQVVEFKLTRESVYAAQQAGWTPVAILDLLRQANGGPPAQNVERSILDWAAAHERVVVRRNATLLAAHDPALLDRLYADPVAGPLLGDRLQPDLALVRPGPAGLVATVADLDRRMLALGEQPATSDLALDTPVPAFVFDAAGRVTWRSALPDLRVLGLLATVTRPGPDGTLALDERTVRATAASRRWGPADILALLDALAAWHSGPLPEAVERQIKIWGGYQGRASLQTVTILRVDRPELLAELQADPTLAPLLSPLTDAGTVALVSSALAPRPGRGRRAAEPSPATDGASDPLDDIRQALLAHGFTLDDSA